MKTPEQIYKESISEAEIKKGIADYLTYQQNLGKLIAHRLNAGSFVITNPDGTRRRIVGAGKGTADFLVIQPIELHFQHYFIGTSTPSQPTTRVTYIEVKRSKAKQSEAQVEFQQRVEGLNCRYELVHSVAELEEILK